MSKENVEIVRRAFACEIYGIGDRAEAEAIFDPDVVMNPTNEGPFHGLDAMREDFERLAGAFEELEVSAEEFIDAGDRVLARPVASDGREQFGIALRRCGCHAGG